VKAWVSAIARLTTSIAKLLPGPSTSSRFARSSSVRTVFCGEHELCRDGDRDATTRDDHGQLLPRRAERRHGVPFPLSYDGEVLGQAIGVAQVVLAKRPQRLNLGLALQRGDDLPAVVDELPAAFHTHEPHESPPWLHGHCLRPGAEGS